MISTSSLWCKPAFASLIASSRAEVNRCRCSPAKSFGAVVIRLIVLQFSHEIRVPFLKTGIIVDEHHPFGTCLAFQID